MDTKDKHFMADASEVSRHLDHLFRREAGRLVSVLTKIFGTHNIDLAETVVQEALVAAVQTWPMQGIPTNPSGWLMRVAKNRALDILKRDRETCVDDKTLEAFMDRLNDDTMNAAFEHEIQDDQLRLMFICCHPTVAEESRVALTLKTICGFGVGEIAKAFLAKDETIAQRLVRAKQRIKEQGLRFEMPGKLEVEPRLDSVLDTIYLLFNEGYAVTEGDAFIRSDLCMEACRLARLLADHRDLGLPRVQALCALLLLQASRLETRLDAHGEVLLLEQQDRTKWNQELIATGLQYLDLAAQGDSLSQFHVLAGIAACHATAASADDTDWSRILGYYDVLLTMNPSPIVGLNRAVAVSFVHGAKKAMAELSRVKGLESLETYYLLPATKAELLRRQGEHEKALTFYTRALRLVRTAPERRFLERRVAECKGLQ